MVLTTYLEEPMRMYACQGNEPKPASSPPTIRLCAVCFAIEIPQPKRRYRSRFFPERGELIHIQWRRNFNVFNVVTVIIDNTILLS